MVEARDKSICKTKSMSSLLFIILFQVQTFFDQAAKSLHQFPTSLQSPNRLNHIQCFGLRPPDPGGLYEYVSNEPENEDSTPPKMRKMWMRRELESLRELNGNTSHVIRLSESPGSTCAISPTIAPSKLTKELGLGITYSDGFMVCFIVFPQGRFYLTLLFSGVDRPQCENARQKNRTAPLGGQCAQ